MSDPDRGRDSSGAIPAIGDCEWNVASADFAYVVFEREELDLIVAESDVEFAIEHTDRRRHRSGFTYRRLKALRGLQVLRTWQSVRDHG
jgi:hypothetical protein